MRANPAKLVNEVVNVHQAVAIQSEAAESHRSPPPDRDEHEDRHDSSDREAYDENAQNHLDIVVHGETLI